jgi:hypothetical protein
MRRWSQAHRRPTKGPFILGATKGRRALGRGEEKPVAVPTLYKTFLFTVCVAVFDIAEGFVRGLTGRLGPMGAVDEVMSRFNYEWLSRAWVIFFAFVPLFASEN